MWVDRVLRSKQFPRDKRENLSIQFAMFRALVAAGLFLFLAGRLCASRTAVDNTSAEKSEPAAAGPPLPVPSTRVVVSVKDQKLLLLENNSKIAVYPVSTSKYGIGDFWGRMTTPVGVMQVAQKIGDHAPIGAVFHNRRPTGEVIPANAPGRDPITTRIIWLRGLEPQNAHAFSRCIYIHGTPEEKRLGHPASYGCIRMKATDVAALYNRLPVGALVQVVPDHLPRKVKDSNDAVFTRASSSAPALKGGTNSINTGGGRGA